MQNKDPLRDYGWRTLPREQRRQWLGWVIQCHADNRALYHSVMG
jgi:hypothetical protein